MPLIYPPTVVLRHRKENLKKCSLRGLEERSDFSFYTYPRDSLPPLNGYILLVLDDAPVVSVHDSARGLFILDATWRYAERMERQTSVQTDKCVRRTLPSGLVTAYPRRQEDCPEPARGLASVEAIYAAYFLMNRDPTGLLNNYHWADSFLQLNKGIIVY